MGTKVFIVFAFMVCVSKCIQGKSMYRNCTVYEENETRDTLPEGIGKYCEIPYFRYEMQGENIKPVNDNRTYCLEYKCPSIECSGNDVVKVEGKCDRCRGDCEWLGNIIKNGSGGVCEDGCNSCGCTDGQVSSTTYVGCNLHFCAFPRLRDTL